MLKRLRKSTTAVSPRPVQAGEGRNVPAHIAIIMDGNGRWAKARNMPRTAGHRKGAEAARALVENAAELGIDYVTLYAFSSENWQRPPEEVNELMELLSFFLDRETQKLHDNNVRLRVIGDRAPLSDSIRGRIESAEALTANNTRLTVVMALSYGSRQEMVRAVRTIAEQVVKGECEVGQIDEAAVSAALDTADIPDPDLLIRTGGNHRISNFLLWQMAYTELFFTDVLWPDFSTETLRSAIDDFAGRERRFGLTTEQRQAQMA